MKKFNSKKQFAESIKSYFDPDNVFNYAFINNILCCCEIDSEILGYTILQIESTIEGLFDSVIKRNDLIQIEGIIYRIRFFRFKTMLSDGLKLEPI